MCCARVGFLLGLNLYPDIQSCFTFLNLYPYRKVMCSNYTICKRIFQYSAIF